ncbi:MAG: PAS domain S-box protein [Candidatus Cloacimonetes bacterium]|nr:PAS domain S-box protein [Candidatus Cloacimonadota bacterium]
MKDSTIVLLQKEIDELKERNGFLQKKLKRFAQAFENSSIGNSIIDLSFRFMYLSSSALTQLGYTNEELSLTSILDITHPDDIELTKYQYDKMLSGEADHVKFEKRYLKKNGSIVWVGVITTLLRSSTDGQPVHFLEQFDDISAKKEAERLLVESELKYKLLFDSMLDGFAYHEIILDDDGVPVDYVFLTVNHTFELLTGLKKNEIVGKRVTEVLPQTEHHWIERYGDVALHGGKVSFEDYSVAFDKYFKVTAYSPEYKRFVSIFIDVTEQRKIEIELNKKIEELDAYFNNAVDLICIADTDGNFIRLNPEWEITLGWSLKEIYAKKFYDFIHPDDIESTLNTVQQLKEQTPIYNFENRYRCKNGDYKWLQWRAVPSGNRLYAAARDISEKKQMDVILEKRVLERTNALEVAYKEMESYSYSVSHDLRAPLRAINGYSKLINEEYSSVLDTEGHRLLGVIQENTLKMSQLIDDLLNFSRLGRSSMHYTEVDMKAIAEKAMQEILSLYPNREVEFVIDDLPPCSGDSAMLKQVWLNLLSNALKFTKQVKRTKIEISFTQTDDFVVYILKDNGIGFDMTYKDKLFGTFQRLHSIKDYEGNGVGLAIVRRIMNRHYGEVSAYSEVGKGATFYLKLPRKEV